MTYFEYLKSIICLENSEYEELLQALNENIFEILPGVDFSEKDYNRISDGLALRKEYEYYAYTGDPELIDGEWPPTYPGSCSFLEFLVALARRIENDFLYEPLKGNRTGKWFLEMIENMGLIFFKGHLSEVDLEHVHEACQTVVNRAYNSDGSGGNIFVLQKRNKCYTFDEKCYTFESKSVTKSVTNATKNVTFDMKKVEIWDQMTQYLAENYL